MNALRKLIYSTLSLSGLFLVTDTIAQPAEISVRAEGLAFNSDCINGLDGLALRPNLGQQAAQIQLIISAKSLNLQSAATVGFVIYSPNNSTVNDTVVSSQMGPEWGGLAVWNFGGGQVNEHFGSGLPDTVITGGAATPGAGFQSAGFIDIMTLEMNLPEDGIICIDSAFVVPSGAWLMTPNGPPLWSGGGGDISVGGLRPSAFCVTVALQPAGEGPCFFPILPPAAEVKFEDTLIALDSSTAQSLGLADFSVTTDGAGIASVDSFGLTAYTPSQLDIGNTVSLELTFSTLNTLSPCPGENRVFCLDTTAISVLPSVACCDVPGDADHSGSMNIADVTFMIARIFSGGPAPLCVNESDADGDGSFNIADVTYLIERIFSSGPAPICGTT